MTITQHHAMASRPLFIVGSALYVAISPIIGLVRLVNALAMLAIGKFYYKVDDKLFMKAWKQELKRGALELLVPIVGGGIGVYMDYKRSLEDIKRLPEPELPEAAPQGEGFFKSVARGVKEGAQEVWGSVKGVITEVPQTFRVAAGKSIPKLDPENYTFFWSIGGSHTLEDLETHSSTLFKTAQKSRW